MLRDREYVVYILGSNSGTLYIGITSNFDSRIVQHKDCNLTGFASKYGCTRLLYMEKFPYVEDAIAREKQLKGWRREKKLALIQTINPDFKDLAEQLGWLQIGPSRSIAEEEQKLQSRFQLPRDPSRKRSG